MRPTSLSKILEDHSLDIIGKILIHKKLSLSFHLLLVEVRNMFLFFLLIFKLFSNLLYSLILSEEGINNTISLIDFEIDKLSPQIILILDLKMLHHRILVTHSNPFLEIYVFLIDFGSLHFLNNPMPILGCTYILLI